MTPEIEFTFVQDVLVDAIIFPAVRVFCSLRIQFSCERLRFETGTEIILSALDHADSRRRLGDLLLSTMRGIGSRVGKENFKRHMSAPIQRLLCTFDALFTLQPPGQASQPSSPRHQVSVGGHQVEPKEDAPEHVAAAQLRAIFTPVYAALLFGIFADLCGRSAIVPTSARANKRGFRRYLELSLANSELMAKLVDMGRWAAPATSPAESPLPASFSFSSLQPAADASPAPVHQDVLQK